MQSPPNIEKLDLIGTLLVIHAFSTDCIFQLEFLLTERNIERPVHIKPSTHDNRMLIDSDSSDFSDVEMELNEKMIEIDEFAKIKSLSKAKHKENKVSIRKRSYSKEEVKVNINKINYARNILPDYVISDPSDTDYDQKEMSNKMSPSADKLDKNSGLYSNQDWPSNYSTAKSATNMDNLSPRKFESKLDLIPETSTAQDSYQTSHLYQRRNKFANLGLVTRDTESSNLRLTGHSQMSNLNLKYNDVTSEFKHTNHRP